MTTLRTATGIRFPPEILTRLADEAAARDVSINFLVNLAVREMLPRLIPVEEMAWTRPPGIGTSKVV